MNTKFSVAILVALVSQLPACGGTDPSGNDGASATEGSGDKTDKTASNPCDIHSGYAGDDLCELPPAAAEGIQIHVGPSDYSDPDAIKPYLLAAGKESVNCFNAKIPESDFYYLRQQNRMRPSSHHMLISVVNDPNAQEGPTACELGFGIASIPGSQTPRSDFPAQLGPEDQGMARYLPQANMASFQMHYINLTDDDVLREAWVNLYKQDPATVTQHMASIFMVGDIAVNVPAHTEQTTNLSFSPTLPAKTRIFEMNAHMHAHAQEFTVWLKHAGEEKVVYQSFSWEDPLQNTFNTVVKNPTPDEATKQDGGLSGLLYMEQGDTIRWACDVNNVTDAPLHFANEALTAEMCMLVGSYVTPDAAGTDRGLFSGVCANGGCSQGFPSLGSK